MAILKVKSTSDPNKVAGAIAGHMREDGGVQIRTLGAGALNQTIKAIAIATNFLSKEKKVLVCQPQFTDVEIEGVKKTAILMNCFFNGADVPAAV
jgi:stage V sporulation protein S